VIRRRFVAFGIAVLSLSVLVTPVAARPTEPVLDPPKTTAALSRGQVDLQPILSGLSQPIGVVNAGDGTNRLFVVQQGGTVRVVSNHRLVAGNFLSIGANPDGLSTGGERGLLGLAFHPDFETNRKLFVNFTDRNGDTVVAELTANSAGTSVSMSTYDPILRIDQPYSNHNGGYLAFGPDGYLYVFTGDGGSAGDPQNRAQSLSSHLGKILRVAPTLTGTYSVPPGNPHVGGDQSRSRDVRRRELRLGTVRGHGDVQGAGAVQLRRADGADRAVRTQRWQLLGHRRPRLPRVGVGRSRRPLRPR
jgi:glucose/arabinose dehydrogenase